MSRPANGDSAAPSARRWVLPATIAAGLAALIGINAHLVYVAFASQPDCVPHARDAGAPGYSAAKSAC